MNKTMSADTAVAIGTALITVPVLALIGLPVKVALGWVEEGRLSSDGLVELVALCVGIALGWAYWSVTIPRWRIWAFERVDDIRRLKSLAIRCGLTYPDGSALARTELKSAAIAARERELDPDAPSDKPRAR